MRPPHSAFPLPPLPVPFVMTGVPVGTVVAFMGDVASQREPLQNQGWLVCDGSPLNSQQYHELFAVIGYQYSAASGGGTFNLPDLRGYFLRGVDPRPDSSNDPDSGSRTLLNGTQGPVVGSVQDCALQTHVHQYSPALSATAESGGEGGSVGVKEQMSSAPMNLDKNPPVTLSQHETRPKNVYVYFIIKSAHAVPALFPTFPPGTGG